MSISRTVYLERSRLLQPKDWAAAIHAAGFRMDLDADFDLEEFSGFLPCKYDGRDAGFEYFFELVTDLDLEDEVASQLGKRDAAISFVTHSDLRGLATAVIAAAVLCDQTHGVLHDEEAGELLSAKEAVPSARELLSSIQSELR